MQFKLRPWTINDLDSLVEYANNFNIAKNLTNAFPHPYTKDDGIKFIEMVSRQDPTQVFAIEVNGRASGGIGIFPQQDEGHKAIRPQYCFATGAGESRLYP